MIPCEAWLPPPEPEPPSWPAVLLPVLACVWVFSLLPDPTVLPPETTLLFCVDDWPWLIPCEAWLPPPEPEPPCWPNALLPVLACVWVLVLLQELLVDAPDTQREFCVDDWPWLIPWDPMLPPPEPEPPCWPNALLPVLACVWVLVLLQELLVDAPDTQREFCVDDWPWLIPWDPMLPPPEPEPPCWPNALLPVLACVWVLVLLQELLVDAPDTQREFCVDDWPWLIPWDPMLPPPEPEPPCWPNALLPVLACVWVLVLLQELLVDAPDTQREFCVDDWPWLIPCEAWLPPPEPEPPCWPNALLPVLACVCTLWFIQESTLLPPEIQFAI